MYVSNASLNLEKQMNIQFTISVKFEIMGNERLSKFLTSPNYNSFFERLNDYIGQNLKMDSICKSFH